MGLLDPPLVNQAAGNATYAPASGSSAYAPADVLDAVPAAPVIGVAEVKDGNVYATDLTTGKRVRLTKDLTITAGPTVIGEGVTFTSSQNGAQWAPVVGGDARPTTTDYTKLSGWGSSTIAGLSSRLAAVSAAYGASYHNGGGSAQVSAHILARIGVRPFTAGAFTIPASGGVTVPITNLPAGATAAFNYTCSIAGIAGTVDKPSGPGAAVTFTRAASGSETSVTAGTAIVPTHGVRQGVVILNMGKNGLTGGSGHEESTEFVQQATLDAYHWFGALTKPVLVVGHFVDTNTPADSPIRAKIDAYNSWARRRFGGRFVDLAAYLTSAQVWTDTGLTPTQTDLDQQALGNKPPSLSTDDLHLNGAGNDAVRSFIKAKIDGLGWYPPVDLGLFAADTFNRADGAVGSTSTGSKPWTTTVSGFAIAGNELSLTGITTSGQMFIDPGAPDVRVQATVKAATGAAATMGGGILVRYIDAANFWWLSTRVSGSSVGCRFWKQVAGSPTAVGTSSSVAVVPGDVVKVEADGNDLVGYVNNVEVARVTGDTHANTGTKVGFFGHTQGTGTRWDDFSVEVI